MLGAKDWRALSGWIRGESAPQPWGSKPLQIWNGPLPATIRAPLIGGNLAVWNSVLGTRFQGRAKGCFLFLEDIDESLYRVDRMLQHLALSGAMEAVKGVILGNFLNCKDGAPQVLKREPRPKEVRRMLTAPRPTELQPLRRTMNEKRALRTIFTEWGRQLQIPVAFGLPVGHGPGVSPLPLGAEYSLSPSGHFHLLNWDWLKSVDTR